MREKIQEELVIRDKAMSFHIVSNDGAKVAPHVFSLQVAKPTCSWALSYQRLPFFSLNWISVCTEAIAFIEVNTVLHEEENQG